MQMEKVQKGVSVVIASHRESYVSDLVDTLLKSAEIVSVNNEIIVVADYPIEEMKQKYPAVHWIYLDDRSISRKRNCGVNSSCFDIIAFVDDDCRVDERWLKCGYSFLEEHEEYCGVEGKTTVEENPQAPAVINQYKRLEKPGYRTNNIFYRKNSFLSVGGFDERFTVQREDLDLAFSLMDKGEKITFDPQIRVTHRFRKGEWWDLLKNSVNRRFDPLLYKKHKKKFRAHVGSPFSGSLFVLLIMHTVALAALGTGPRCYIMLADIVLVSILTVRRTGKAGLNISYYLKEWFCMFSAPFVITSALLYGSVKYRKFLLF